MKLKIMIITSKYLFNYINKLIDKMDLNYDITIKVYENFSNISEVYNKYVNSVDGFLVSGKIAKAAILNSVINLKKPVVSFDITVAEIYRSIINLMIENKNIDLNRVIFDFQIPVGDNISVSHFLNNIDQNFPFSKIVNWTKNLNLDHINIIEEQLVNEIRHLWEYKVIDCIVCQYSSIIPYLEKNKIPFIYPLPTGEQLYSSIKRLVTMIEMKKMRNNFPVILRLDLLKLDLQSINDLECLLKKFFNDNLINCNIQIDNDNIKIQLTVSQFLFITDNAKTSKLTKYLNDNKVNNVIISYGIGNNFYEALKNSDIAKRESILKNGSYVVDENENLIGPLDSDNYLIIKNTIDDKIIKISRSSNLSTTTIQKIIAITKMNQSKKITASELAIKLDSSVRNANRILQNIASGGYAKVLLEKTTNTKGRPTKVYILDI